MFEPIDAQFGAARRLRIEVVRHRDEARDERLIAPESDRVAAVDRHDRDRRPRTLPRRRDERGERSEEHTSELQSLMRISYAVFCLKKKKNIATIQIEPQKSIDDI